GEDALGGAPESIEETRAGVRVDRAPRAAHLHVRVGEIGFRLRPPRWDRLARLGEFCALDLDRVPGVVQVLHRPQLVAVATEATRRLLQSLPGPPEGDREHLPCRFAADTVKRAGRAALDHLE